MIYFMYYTPFKLYLIVDFAYANIDVSLQLHK